MKAVKQKLTLDQPATYHLIYARIRPISIPETRIEGISIRDCLIKPRNCGNGLVA